MGEKEIPGWKLVHGRGTRKWTQVDKTIVALSRKAGLLKADCYVKPKLLSPAQIEKAAAKIGRVTKQYFSEFWEMGSGGPTIALNSDPREPYKSNPEEDFKDA